MAVGCEEQLCGAHRNFISSGHERISEDEVDMEDREIAVPVYVKAGTREEECEAVVDTGAFSIWMDERFFKSFGGEVIADAHGAKDVSDRPIAIAGKGGITFTLWGHEFEDYPVRIMKQLPSKMLIGRKFWLKHQLKMDLFNSRGTLLVNGEFISGSIGLDKQNPRLELVRALIEDADVDGVIRDLDLSEFHDDGKLQAALREILWYQRHIFKGVGCVNGYEHKIRLKEGAEPVAIPIRRRSPAEEAAEKEMVLTLVGQGVLEKAESP